MIKGLIQSFTFELPVGAGEQVENAIVVFAQSGVEVVVKQLTDLTIENDLLTVTLTQAETGTFAEGALQMQIQMEMASGRQYASEILQTLVYGTLGGVVIGQ